MPATDIDTLRKEAARCRALAQSCAADSRRTHFLTLAAAYETLAADAEPPAPPPGGLRSGAPA